MKKKNNIYLVLLVLAIVGSSYLSLEKVSAESNVFGNGPFTTILGNHGMAPFPSDSIQPSINPHFTEYERYSSSNVLQSNYTYSEVMGVSEGYVRLPLATNQYIRITYAGYQNGRPLDLILTNKTNELTVDIYKNGNIDANVANDGISGLKQLRHILTMKYVYHDTEIPVANKKYPLNQRQTVYYLNNSFTFYDMHNTEQLYGIDLGDFMTNTIMYMQDVYGHINFRKMEMIAKQKDEYFSYLVRGVTNSQGEYPLYFNFSGTKKNMVYNIIEHSLEDSPVHVPYPPLTSIVNSTTISDGREVSLKMIQRLPDQSIPNYFPSGDSFNLVIKEDSVDYLEIDIDDFKLYIDGNEVNETNYSLSVNNIDEDTYEIVLNLTSAFVKQHAGKSLSIEQVSSIKNDETIIRDSLDNDKLPINISAALDYELESFGQQTVTTLEQNFLIGVVSNVTAETVTDFKVSEGTQLGNVPISNIVTSAINETYPWDTISAVYREPETILDEDSSKGIVIDLISNTFGTITSITVDLQIQNYYLSIVGLEQVTWTTDTQLTANTNWVSGKLFESSSSETGEEITVDSVTITSKKGPNDSEFIQTDEVDMLVLGQTIYRVTVVGSADLNGEHVSFIEEQIDVPITIKNLQLTAQPVTDIQVGRLTNIDEIDLQTWVKDVQLEGRLTANSLLTQIELAENLDYTYTVTLKEDQHFYSDVIGFQDYTLIVTADTLINGQQSFGPIEVNVTVLVTGLGLSHPDKLEFHSGNSESYKNQLLTRKETDWTIEVQDTRVNPSTNWSLYVKLEQPFLQTTSGGVEQEIRDILVYRGEEQSQNAYNNSVYIDSESYQIITGKGNISKSWGEDFGFLLMADSRTSMSIQPGDYSAILQFTLADVPL